MGGAILSQAFRYSQTPNAPSVSFTGAQWRLQRLQNFAIALILYENNK